MGLWFWICLLLGFSGQITSFDLRLVHLNDMHGRVDGMPRFESACKESEFGDSPPAREYCDGGWPKIFTAAKSFVASAKGDTLFLEDGDQFTGTVWSTFYKGSESSTFLNLLCGPAVDGGAGFSGCAGCLGNHEFDFGYETTASYTKSLHYDLVVANVDDQCPGRLLGNALKRSTVFTLQGNTKVGVVGYLTPETTKISVAPTCFRLSDEVKAIQAEVDTLKASGVNIIIALGHSGYNVDQVIAAQVSGLDVVVGGHTHTFLWDGRANPTVSGGGVQTNIMGPYPTIKNAVPVVQAYFGSRYLGLLDLVFDDNGELLKYTPGIVLLGKKAADSSAPQEFQFDDDPMALALVKNMSVALNEWKKTEVGKSKQLLPGTRELVRTVETALGNAIADSILENLQNPNFINSYGPPDFAIINGGGIRGTIEEGPIEVEDILTALPFGNVISARRLSAIEVYLLAETSTSNIEGVQGGFLQVSKGVQFFYDTSLLPACSGTATKCTTGVCTPCTRNSVPNRVYEVRVNGRVIPFDDSRSYLVAMPNFIAEGKDYYDFLLDTELVLATGSVIADAFTEYVDHQTNGPSGGLVSQIEGRLVDRHQYPGCFQVPDGALAFCGDSLGYSDVYLSDGSDSLRSLDEKARDSYFSAALSSKDACCLFAYRDYLCAAHLPRCIRDDRDEAQSLLPCSNWLCSTGSCFSETCEAFPSSPYECSCPLGLVANHSACLPGSRYDCASSYELAASGQLVCSMWAVLLALFFSLDKN